MRRFEEVVVDLSGGRILPLHEHFIFEIDDPFQQVVIPVSCIEFFLRCDSRKTVREVIIELGRDQFPVHFENLVNVLIEMHDRGLIDLPLGSQPTKSSVRQAPLEVSIPIGERVANPRVMPILGYAMSLVALLLGVFGWVEVSSQLFVMDWLDASQTRTLSYVLVFQLFMISNFLTLKAIYQSLLLLFFTGRIYGLSLKFNGLLLYLSVSRQSERLIPSDFLKRLYHMSGSLIPFSGMAILIITGALSQPSPIITYALVVFLWAQCNPVWDGELTWAFGSHGLGAASNASWSLRLREEIDRADYPRSTYHASWAKLRRVWPWIWLLTSGCALGWLGPQLLNLWSQEMQHESIGHWILLNYLLILIVMQGVRSHIEIIERLADFVKNGVIERLRFSYQQHIADSTYVLAQLRELPFFGHLSDEALGKLIELSQMIQYSAGHTIIQFGESTKDVFVLLSGELTVKAPERSGQLKRVADLYPVTIFGELAAIEGRNRTAAIDVRKKSLVMRIPFSVVTDLATHQLMSEGLANFKNAILVSQFFRSAPVFRKLKFETCELLTQRSRIEEYEVGAEIMAEGSVKDGFFMVLRGSLAVLWQGDYHAMIHQGQFFGEISLLAHIPRTASLIAVESVTLLRLSKPVFWEIIAQDLELAVWVEIVAEQRLKQMNSIKKSQPVAYVAENAEVASPKASRPAA